MPIFSIQNGSAIFQIFNFDNQGPQKYIPLILRNYKIKKKKQKKRYIFKKLIQYNYIYTKGFRKKEKHSCNIKFL